MATINDVSKLANVSSATVSRVINNNLRVAVEIREKVNEAIKELNYKPNLSAQTLASNRSNSIGMLLDILAGPYYSALLSSAEETARNNNFHLIPTSGNQSRERELDAIDFLKAKQVDGLLIHTGMLTDEDILKIVAEMPATILLNHYIPEIAENCIGLDDELGGYLAVKYLLENGHTKIGCITGQMDKQASRNRLQGYRNALIEYGIPYDDRLIVEGRFDLKDHHLAPRRLLDRNTQLTAVFCLNDPIAWGLYDVLNERGISIGDDISVIGFDNNIYGPHLHPKLTSINFPTSEMGAEAAKKVLSLIKKRAYSIQGKLVPELVIRNSVKRIN
ncbi:LacI family DNA-binding transcriptional regulator [Psychromonas sp.]|uniref:LacI family DNA-binding transcriptional regulator n=1 Tax=Psychromonas sp. TaxID=1884585 RepID=UPI0039E6D8EB